MMTAEYTTTNVFANEITALKQARFSGQMLLKGPLEQEWTFYLYLGRILYTTGGVHSVRRWQRNLATYCPQIAVHQLNLPTGFSSSDRSWEYQLLCFWVKQQQISRDQAVQLIRAAVTEVLFDITQVTQVMYQVKPDPKALSSQLVLVDAEQALAEAQQVWQTWQTARLAGLLPNRAPIIKRPEELQQQTSASTYQTLAALLNGQRTLRELALQMKRKVVEVTCSLLPYIQVGVVELIDIPDLPAPIPPTSTEVLSAAHPGGFSIQVTSQAPLVACVDDSPLVCQTMEQLLTEAGYRFVGVQDSLRAIATLVSRKPDLIFLDLVMPNTNGYEICSQLRKVSAFRSVPIVILTGNDGIVDRVRAKVAGSSDFLSKPLDAETLLTVLNRHLPKMAHPNVT